MEALVQGIVFADFHGDIRLSGWYCSPKNGYFLCSTVEMNRSPRLLLFTERIFHSVSKPALTKSLTGVQFLMKKSSGQLSFSMDRQKRQNWNPILTRGNSRQNRNILEQYKRPLAFQKRLNFYGSSVGSLVGSIRLLRSILFVCQNDYSI